MSFLAHRASPADAVEAAFRRILRERMDGLPMLNPALSVEAVGFQRWQGQWLGAVVSPWCMSLILLPGGAAGWASAGANERRFVRFAANDLVFLGGDEPETGEYQCCSLFASMAGFTSQSEATSIARAALAALLAPPAAPAHTGGERSAGATSPSRRRFLVPGAASAR